MSPLPEVRPVRLIALERVAHPMRGSVLAGTLQSPAQVGADLPVSQTEVVDNRRRNLLLSTQPEDGLELVLISLALYSGARLHVDLTKPLT